MNVQAGSARRPFNNTGVYGDVYGDEVPPVLIPNTEVKLISADGTWLDTARESMTMPVPKRRAHSNVCSFFLQATIVMSPAHRAVSCPHPRALKRRAIPSSKICSAGSSTPRIIFVRVQARSIGRSAPKPGNTIILGRLCHLPPCAPPEGRTAGARLRTLRAPLGTHNLGACCASRFERAPVVSKSASNK